MSNRLEVLTNNMDATTKWGCGSVFMLGVVVMTWVVSSYTYHTFWAVYVGKEEYKDLKEHFIQENARIEKLVLEVNTAQQTNYLRLKDELQAADAQLQTTLNASLQTLQLELNTRLLSLDQNIAGIHSSIATVNTQSYITTEDLQTRYRHLQQVQEELAILKSAMAKIVEAAESR